LTVSATATPPQATAPAAASTNQSHRDLTLDFARVLCVILVVITHLLLVGIGRSTTGQISVARTLELQSWFNGVSWGGQIMPLFFVVGGFASLTAWRGAVRKGGTAAEYVRGRVIRLALPALPLFIFYVIVIGAAILAGVDRAFLQGVTTGAGSPLWFIAAYVLVQAFVPTMAGFHQRAPKLTLVILLACAILVDVLRYSTGITEIGLINLAFVWLFIQQVGFWYADGWFARRAWWQLVLIAVVCYLALVPLTTIGPYSADMLSNLNPPTIPLIVLAVAQACVLRLLKRPLSALMRTRGAQGFVYLAGTRLMTIYLWHLPLIIALSGLCLIIPGALPAPASAVWWWTRIPFFVILLAGLYGISFLVGRFERPRTFTTTPSPLAVGVAALLAFIPTFAILEWFLDFNLAALGAVFIAAAVLLLGWRPWPTAEQRRTRKTAALS
jgi:fucose 4-O-acetylase-like acetyltransferase